MTEKERLKRKKERKEGNVENINRERKSERKGKW